MKKKTIACLLVGAMVTAMLAGCGSGDSGKKEDTAKKDGKNTPLVVAIDDMSEKFSPFFAASVPDQNIVDVTQIGLIYNDRAGEFILDGVDGYTAEYNGTEYTYYTPANLEITENEDGTVYYDFTLKDDLKFSDGEEVTADDVIFSFYVNCDPTYDGSASTYALPIKGMEEYRSGMSTLSSLIGAAGEDNTDFTYWTEEEQTAFWDAVNDGGVKFAQEIIDYCVEAGAAADKNDAVGAAAAWNLGELPEGATAKDMFLLIGDLYGWNFSEMDAEKVETSLEDLMGDVYAYSTEGIEVGEGADYISGIEKTGEKSVRVILTEVDATAVSQLGISIAPLHYYGDESKFDYDAHQFGFEKGDLSSVRAKTTTPLGAGPYKFVSYENKIVYMEANENYFRGEPKIKELQFKTTSQPDKLPGVIEGTVDISDPSISKDAIVQIKEANGNDDINGDKVTTQLVDNRGYGYIGMCSLNVKVGDDPASEQSKDLRKAIATVLAVYRDVVIDSYYGDAATVINYPISNTSWAAPQKSDADYKVAFSVDVNGDPIYTEGMNEDEKYEAALNAALGYLEAAGYTVENGKVTAAPEGAKMEYEMVIPASGSGDHPAFGILTAASEAMEKIGLKLTINDLADSSILWDGLDAQTVEIWCAAWQTTIDPDMYQIYHSEGGSSGHYAIYSDELDKLVLEGRTNTDQEVRKAIYKEALDFVVDYAVEIPVYQRQNGTVISTERVNVDTLVKDPTTYYEWMSEIETLEMN